MFKNLAAGKTGAHHNRCPRVGWADILPNVHAPEHNVSRLKGAIPDACEQFDDAANESDV